MSAGHQAVRCSWFFTRRHVINEIIELVPIIAARFNELRTFTARPPEAAARLMCLNKTSCFLSAPSSGFVVRRRLLDILQVKRPNRFINDLS